MIKLLVWNIRGVGNLASCCCLRKFCRLHSIFVLVLIEPFIDNASIFPLQTYLGFSAFVASESNKILLLWRHIFAFTVVSQTFQLLHLHGTHPQCLSGVFLTPVYAKFSYVER